MKVYNVKIDTRNSNDSSLWEGGGILGHAGEGSVLELSGCTDLTNVNFQGRSNGIVGQLVKENECGLVYAKGDEMEMDGHINVVVLPRQALSLMI